MNRNNFLKAALIKKLHNESKYNLYMPAKKQTKTP